MQSAVCTASRTPGSRVKSASAFGASENRLLQFIHAIDAVDQIRMNLPQRDDAHFVGAERMKEFRAVFEHALARVPIGEAEIQGVRAALAARTVARRLRPEVRLRRPGAC